MARFTCTAAGDAMVFRRLPGEYEGFEELQRFLAQGDFRFLNLETTIHNFETYGAAESGGSWFCAPPAVLEDVKTFGFNILTTANNHALDYGHVGLEKTLQYLESSGIPFSGTGRSLADASAPAYLDTLQGRFALISTCSSFKPSAMAGEQTRTMPGRPGMNHLRFNRVFELPKEDMDHLRRIAEDININAADNITRKEGYLPPVPEDRFVFGTYNFRLGETAREVTTVNETDMKRMEQNIREARFMSDYVCISIHSHELSGTSKEMPSQFLQEFAHRCIDAGADAIIGTGPHLLRPIEIYKGKPIFYSLGDFIIQLENIRKAPAGMYEKQGLTGNEGLDVMFNARSDNGKKGLYYQRVMFESVIPYWEVEDGKLTCIKLMPVELRFDEHRSTGGWPRPKYDAGIIERLAKMSADFGTRIEIDENGYGVVRL